MIKITLSGEIGWTVTPKNIIDQLDAAKGDDIEVHLASPGGSVFDGIEIFNAFRDYKRKYPEAQMMLQIKGLAASMASYISVNPAFDLITAEDNAVLMIHNVWGMAMGDYRDMNKTAEIFEGLTDLLAQAYTKKTKKSQKAIRQLMDDETWYFGQELLDGGFVDEIIKTEEEKDKSVALATAKLSFKTVSDKLQTQKVDIEKIAACIQPPTPPEKPDEQSQGYFHNVPAGSTTGMNNAMPDKGGISGLPRVGIETTTTANNPAGAGKNNNGGVKMTLEELKAQHPALYNDVFNAGREAQKKESADITAKAGIYIKADSSYPASIKALAIEVIEGKATIESLQTTVKAFDAFKESQASEAAKTEGGLDVNGGGNNINPPADGVVNSRADEQAEIKRMRSDRGLEVK